MIYEFKGFRPVIHESSFIHPLAVIIGNVIIGKNVYVAPGAVLRGDWGAILIGDGCNIQENCIIHMFPGVTVTLKESAHMGHGSIVHGATIGKNCLIGMNSVVMDNAELGDECILGALTLVEADQKIPPRSVVVGKGKIIKEVTEQMLEWKTKGTELYQSLPADLHATLKECEPLREIEPNRPSQEILYKTWKETKPTS